MSDEPRKRSRFDQTESDARPSRFDRRSRSPKNRNSEPRQRTRSPVSATNSPAPRDPAAAAAAAAAKINAQIQARKGVQHVDVPPIRSVRRHNSFPYTHPLPVLTRHAQTESPSGAGNQSPGAAGLNADIYTQDGDFIRDIEVNDLRNRYTLTKGSTQKMVNLHRCVPLMLQLLPLLSPSPKRACFGHDHFETSDCSLLAQQPRGTPVLQMLTSNVTTRGSYYPDKAMATAANPPLYLHVTSTTRDGLEKAVAEIDELMKQDLPNLVDERRFRRREPEQVERDSMGRRKWPEEKIPVDLEPIVGFNLRAQVVGQGGSYVKHIQQETRCRVQIKGRGSGFMEHDTGAESDESMYLHVAGPDPNEVLRAKELCLDLLANVRTQYEQFKERGPRGGRGPGNGGDDYGDRRGGYGDRGYGGDRDRNSSYGGGYGGGRDSGRDGSHGGASYNGGYQGAASPATAHNGAAAMSPGAAATPDYAQAYAQYYQQNGADPYAAYGGYEAYTRMYWQYYQQQQAGGVPGAEQASEYDNSAAPPPPSDDAPPPPPGASSGYNSVPPPPGM
ncbi:hypothetical protein E4T52_13868 [Aureobasidium sp. EXF-3400]|nr:hypothetical protein E4T51_12908 [Aureobasidium sp. EXF-12344]KAI4771128.1 hypothetical protein E4T52_13868 [Aureobasidium sp. EXF-3400]